MDYTLNDKVAVLAFDDSKANAVSHDFINAMNEGLDRAEQEASAVIIMGRPGVFSAGFDLKEIQKGADAAAALVSAGGKMFHRLFNHPQPVIAGCTGHAIAAGALLLLSCDTRIGTAGNFKLGLNETAIGMTLPVFGLELAENRISKRHLTAAVIQSRLYDPDSAVDAGYLDEVVTPTALVDRCREAAEPLLGLPVATYGKMKRDVRQQSLARIRDSLT